MQNIIIQYELNEGLHGPERIEAAALMSQKDIKDIKEENMIWSIEEKTLIMKEKGIVKKQGSDK